MADGIADDTMDRDESSAAGEPLAGAAQPESGADDAERARTRQSLELQREQLLEERNTSPHRGSTLDTLIASVEEQLSELGWMLHL